MTWIFENDILDDDDDKMGALKRRADKWSKRYIHELLTLIGVVRIHFRIFGFQGEPPLYHAHVTSTQGDRDFDVILRWDIEAQDWRVKNDASIPNMIDGGWQILQLVREYMVTQPAIMNYIESYNKAQAEIIFLQEKMVYLKRALDWAELNSKTSIEACEIIHDLYEAYNED